MPRVRMTSSCPIASIAITAVWESTLPTLRVVRNTGERNDIADDDQGQDQHRSEADHDEAEAQRSVGSRRQVGCRRDGVGLGAGHRSAVLDCRRRGLPGGNTVAAGGR